MASCLGYVWSDPWFTTMLKETVSQLIAALKEPTLPLQELQVLTTSTTLKNYAQQCFLWHLNFVQI